MANLEPKKTIIWNQFDEFGLIAGLGHWSEDGKSLEYVRFSGETNKQLKARTKEAMLHQGNSTLQGMVNNISRDLGVIDVSGFGILPWYNTMTRSTFFLSDSPYPEASGSGGSGNIKVYVSTSGIWTDSNRVYPQVRASDYSSSTSGWIVWHQPDIIPSMITSGLPGSYDWHLNRNQSGVYDDTPRYGRYETILEFIGDTIPNSEDEVMIEYIVQTGTDDLGRTILNWRSDYGHIDDPKDDNFRGYKSDIETSVYDNFIENHVILYDMYNIKSTPVSGYFYTSDGRPTQKLIDMKNIITANYPLHWGKFRYDEGMWDQLDNASIGVIPSFHDDVLGSGTAIEGGVNYGADIDNTGIEITSSGARAAWYPKFQPGEFYIGHSGYYMFANHQSEVIDMVSVMGGYLLSGTIFASGDQRPGEMEVLLGYSSGYYDNISNNPWIRPVHQHLTPTSGIYYREPYINYSGGFNPSGILFGGSGSFNYNYESGEIWASGITSGLVLVWEDRGVISSGVSVIYSGGYGFNTINLNPMADISNKMFYIED